MPLGRVIADCRGAAAAEFALVLPLMLILLFAFFEAGRLFWTYHVVSASARDAARYAAHLPVNCATNSVTGVDAVKNVAVTGQVTGGTPLIAGWSTANVTVAVACQPIGSFTGRYTGMSSIPTVSVTATAPFRTIVSRLFPGFSFTSVTVKNSQVWTE